MARLNALACQLLIRVPSEGEIDFSKCRIALFPKGYKNPDISPKAHAFLLSNNLQTLELAAARILDKLRQSPFSVEDQAFDLKRNAAEVRLLVNALLRDGSIVKLDTDREAGPFYAPACYVEPSNRLDNSDLVLGRDYSGQYEAPIWRDDA
jgi:hypothetical protein